MDLRYPIGPFTSDAPITPADRAAWIDGLATLPSAFRHTAASLSEAQLDTPYRDGGWTLRQVVHHVPDSHLNAYVRFCWALTETSPRIKAYDEVAWAGLPLYADAVEPSLVLLEALHARWVLLLLSLDDEQWERSYDHPESGPQRLDWTLGSYAWHGQHHLAHLTTAIQRFGWQ